MKGAEPQMKQLMNTLYITNDNVSAKVKRQAFEFQTGDENSIVHIPFHEIEKILVFGKPDIDESMYSK